MPGEWLCKNSYRQTPDPSRPPSQRQARGAMFAIYPAICNSLPGCTVKNASMRYTTQNSFNSKLDNKICYMGESTMKRLLAAILTVAFSLTFSACGNGAVASQAEYNKLLLENERLRERLEELEGPSSDPMSNSEDIWEVLFYVDDFKQPTTNAYVSGFFSGTFSNSATTNSDLRTRILVDSTDVTIMLYEYSRSMVKNSSSRNLEFYDITMRTGDDNRTSITGYIPTEGDRIFIVDANREDVINALSGDGDVDFYIVNTDRATTKYLFTAATANFADAVQSLS